MKKFVLFDHDGVLLDTEFWYYEAGERALADIGVTFDEDHYLLGMNQLKDIILGADRGRVQYPQDTTPVHDSE